ncbi:GAF domain-containing protein [Variovorax sp. RKNM96]|uniref:GAF domain-containing protein n=1 Tax=Variovorax sp. RKNM96 TaxID=2681552 RepID=UPI003217794A
MTDAGVLPLAVCEQLCNALPRAATFDAAMGHIEAARLALLGPGLLTVNLNATTSDDPPDEVQLQRLWSSNPQAYPVAGRKRKTLTPWTRQLLVRAEVFIGEGDAALAEVFDDHALITALGLRAVVNVPLLEDGRCAATFNVLGTRARWMPEEIALVKLLALVATPWVLRARHAA